MDLRTKIVVVIALWFGISALVITLALCLQAKIVKVVYLGPGKPKPKRLGAKGAIHGFGASGILGAMMGPFVVAEYYNTARFAVWYDNGRKEEKLVEVDSYEYNRLVRYIDKAKCADEAEPVSLPEDDFNVDWNEQALRFAQERLSEEPLSRSGLMKLLLQEGFTQEQADYAVETIERK